MTCPECGDVEMTEEPCSVCVGSGVTETGLVMFPGGTEQVMEHVCRDCGGSGLFHVCPRCELITWADGVVLESVGGH